MNTYIDCRGCVISTSMPAATIAKECCQICAATMLRQGVWLCDYPTIEDHALTRKVHKTCDAVLCNAHAYRIAKDAHMTDEQGSFIDDVHVCPAHYQEWLSDGKPEFWKQGSDQ